MELNQIINEVHTPGYLFNEIDLKNQIDMIKEASKTYGLCFAMKANPFMVNAASKYVDHIEVCSPGEYEICRRMHIDPEKMIVSGVNKTMDAIERIMAYSNGKGIYTIESRAHFEILRDVSKKLEKNINVLIRLSSGNQFGVDEETFLEILELILHEKTMQFTGIHFYSGTQKKLAKIEKELNMLDIFAKRIKDTYGISNILLEYGPGLGVSYFVSDGEMQGNEETDEMKRLNDLAGKCTGFSSITFEMGRFIASSCGCYFTKIADIKRTGRARYIIVDGGIHQISYYGQMLGMKHPHIEHIAVGKREQVIDDAAGDAVNEETYTICGSLCTVNDILVRDYKLKAPSVGDILVFFKCGAYAVTEGMALFLSRELPEVFICDINRSITRYRRHIETNQFNSYMEE